MNLIIADINSWCVYGKSNGHYISVAQNLMNIFKDSGVDVRVAGGPVYQHYFAPEDLICLPYNVEPDDNILVRKFHNLKNLYVLLCSAKEGDRIIFQASASGALFWGLACAWKLKTKNYLIQYSSTEGLSSSVKRLFWRLARSRISGLVGPSEEIGRAFNKPICVVPDYICLKEPFDNVPADRIDFSFVGTVTPKKGVVDAVDCLVRAGFTVLVAGRADVKDADFLNSLSMEFDNLRLHIGYLSDPEYVQAIDQGVYSVLNYSSAYSQQSSGVVFDSLFRLRPVLGKRCKALQFVEDYGMGILYDDIRTVDLRAVLEENRVVQMKNNIREYLRMHQKWAAGLRAYVLR